MHPFPHHYAVTALAGPAGVVTLRSPELEDVQSTAPPEFGGPPGNWSPETLLVAAVADCFVLSFRAVANASKLEWTEIDCGAVGVLDKTAEGMWFTAIELSVNLRIPAGADPARAERLLQKAEQSCLVTRSLKSAVHLNAQVRAG